MDARGHKVERNGARAHSYGSRVPRRRSRRSMEVPSSPLTDTKAAQAGAAPRLAPNAPKNAHTAHAEAMRLAAQSRTPDESWLGRSPEQMADDFEKEARS